MPRVVLFIHKAEMRCRFVMEEEQTCCAGLAGICCGWDVAACPGDCFEGEGKGRLPCTAVLHFGILFLAAGRCFSMLSIQIASQGTASGNAGVGLGFLLCK